MNRNTTAHLRHVALLLAAGLLAACGQDSRDLGERSALGLDLQRPDALIESASLSRLPKDLLAVPLLRDTCLLYTSPSPRDKRQSRMPSSA